MHSVLLSSWSPFLLVDRCTAQAERLVPLKQSKLHHGYFGVQFLSLYGHSQYDAVVLPPGW